MERIVGSYNGPEKDERVLKALRVAREALAEDPISQSQLWGFSLREYGIPMLSAHLTEVSEMAVEFQSAALSISAQLDLFNQTVREISKETDRVKDASTPEPMRQATINNLDQLHGDLVRRAMRISRAISQLAKN